MTPAEARLLWLAANADWELSGDLGAMIFPPWFASQVLDVFDRWRAHGWIELYEGILPAGNYFPGRWSLTALGRREAARYTPALLHHAGACIPRCPLCPGKET